MIAADAAVTPTTAAILGFFAAKATIPLIKNLEIPRTNLPNFVPNKIYIPRSLGQ